MLHHVFHLFFTATALSVNQQRTVRCPSEARLLRSSVCGPLPHPASLPPGDQPLPNPPHSPTHPCSERSYCHIEVGNFPKFHLCWFEIKPHTVSLVALVVPKDNIFHIFFSIHIHFCSPVHCCSPVAVELDLPL